MARKNPTRAAKKRAQETLSGGGEAQPPRRGGQGRAQAPQDAENGAPPRVNDVNLAMAQLLA